MGSIIPAIILSAAFLAIALITWHLLFRHIFQVRRKLSFNIREKIFPDMQRTVNVLVSLAAAAIVLTFSITKVPPPIDITHRVYLVLSWLGFALSILFGISSLVVLYIWRALSMIVMRELEVLEDRVNQLERTGRDEESDEPDELGPLIDRARQFERKVHLCTYCQFVAFVSAVIFLLIFSIVNI
ncbi:MAG TPA: hypothetical protein VN285_12270 [Candidatus Deferrimicrobium sp.]|nr:hypothetical protein [Candidatus Deferrimicrobium sp.]